MKASLADQLQVILAADVAALNSGWPLNARMRKPRRLLRRTLT